MSEQQSSADSADTKNGFAIWHPKHGISINTVQASRQQAQAILDKHPEKVGAEVRPVMVCISCGLPANEGTERSMFIEKYHKNLDLTEAQDAWGRPIFKHSHVQALWEGWICRASLMPVTKLTKDDIAQIIRNHTHASDAAEAILRTTQPQTAREKLLLKALEAVRFNLMRAGYRPNSIMIEGIDKAVALTTAHCQAVSAND